MFRPRIIPVLLLSNNVLVKSVCFKNHKYIGDPINAVRIFNDFRADELVFLDILATKQNRPISVDFVKLVGEEANMPFSVGGGIISIEVIRNLLKAGAEKVVIGTKAAEDPDFVRHASEEFGSSTVVVCMDVKKRTFGKQTTSIINGSTRTKYSPEEFAVLMEEKGAGELIVQSIDNDGKMNGYDLKLIRNISEIIKIPVIALGGAGKLSDLKEAYQSAYANGLAAGSIFVYYGSNKGVLINYPEKKELSFD